MPAATDSAYSCPSWDVPRVTTSKPGVCDAPGSTTGTSKLSQAQLTGQHRDPAGQVPLATAVLTACSLGMRHHGDAGGSWLARTAAAISWDEAPDTPMCTAVLEAGAGERQARARPTSAAAPRCSR